MKIVAGRRHGNARAAVLFAAVFVPCLVLAAAEQITGHAWSLAMALLVLPPGGWLLGRWQGTRSGQVLPRRDKNRAELVALRAQAAELEALARRDMASIISSYRAVQSRYQSGGKP